MTAEETTFEAVSRMVREGKSADEMGEALGIKEPEATIEPLKWVHKKRGVLVCAKCGCRVQSSVIGGYRHYIHKEGGKADHPVLEVEKREVP